MTTNTMVQDLEEGEILENEKDCLEKKSCSFYQLGQCRLGKKCPFFHLTGLGLYRMIDLDFPAIPTTEKNVPNPSPNIPLRQMSSWDASVQGFKEYVHQFDAECKRTSEPVVITIESDDEQPSLVQTKTPKPLVLNDSLSSSSGSRFISDKNDKKGKHVVRLLKHSKRYSNLYRQSKLTSESSSTSSTNSNHRSPRIWKRAHPTHLKQRHPKVSAESQQKLAIRQSSSTSSSPVYLYKIKKRSKFQSMRQEKKPRTDAKEYITPPKSHSFTSKEVMSTPTSLRPCTLKKTSPATQINAFKTSKKFQLSSYIFAKYNLSISPLTDSSLSDLFDPDKNTLLKDNACHAEVNQLCEFLPKTPCEREVYGPVLAVSSSPKKMKTNTQTVAKKYCKMRNEANGPEREVYGPVLAIPSSHKTMKMNTWPVVKKKWEIGNEAKFSEREIYGPVSAITSSNKKMRTNTCSVVKKNCEKRNKANGSEGEVYGPVLAVSSSNKKIRIKSQPVVKSKWEMENEANDSEGEIYVPVLAVTSSHKKINTRLVVKNNSDMENEVNGSEREVYGPVLAVTSSNKKMRMKSRPVVKSKWEMENEANGSEGEVYGPVSAVTSSCKKMNTRLVVKNNSDMENEANGSEREVYGPALAVSQSPKKMKMNTRPVVKNNWEKKNKVNGSEQEVYGPAIAAKTQTVTLSSKETKPGACPEVKSTCKSKRVVKRNIAFLESDLLKFHKHRNISQVTPVQKNTKESKILKESPVQQDAIESEVLEQTPVQQDTKESKALKESPIQQDMKESEVSKEPSVQQDLEESQALKESSVQQDAMESKVLEQTPVQQDTKESKALKESPVQQDAMDSEVVEESPIQQDTMESEVWEEISVQQDLEDSQALEESPVQQDTMESEALKEPPDQLDMKESEALKEPPVQHRKTGGKQIGTFSSKKQMLLKQLQEINAAIERRLKSSCQEVPKK